MKKIIFCIIISLWNLPVFALDYKDFPPALQQMLDERIAEMEPNGGICVAGIVTMSDEAHIGSGNDVKVNLNEGIDEPLWVYNDGWFIMSRTFKKNSFPKPAKLLFRAFGYDPIDASLAILHNQITYVEFEMHKTPAEKLGAVSGIILNDQNEPVEGALVYISFPFSYSVANGQPQMSMYTEPNGHYSFEGLSLTEHHLWVPSLLNYAGIAFEATPTAGKTIIANRKLYRNLSITIDFIYQPDGSRSFKGETLKTGTLNWANGHEMMDFSEGRVKGYEPNSLPDLLMMQEQDKLRFVASYSNGQNGFYDAGDVDFDSITEDPEKGYSTNPKPCVIGHTYIVKTFENKYAKFVVVDISGTK